MSQKDNLCRVERRFAMSWLEFVQQAATLGYPFGVDAQGVTIVGFPGGYIAPATDGPAGPRVWVVQDVVDVVYDMPTRKDVESFLRRAAPR